MSIKVKLKLLRVKMIKIGLSENNFYLNLQILVMIRIELYKNQMDHGHISLVMLPITKIN